MKVPYINAQSGPYQGPGGQVLARKIMRSPSNTISRRPQHPLNGGRSGVSHMYTSNVNGGQTAGRNIVRHMNQNAATPTVPPGNIMGMMAGLARASGLSNVLQGAFSPPTDNHGLVREMNRRPAPSTGPLNSVRDLFNYVSGNLGAVEPENLAEVQRGIPGLPPVAGQSPVASLPSPSAVPGPQPPPVPSVPMWPETREIRANQQKMLNDMMSGPRSAMDVLGESRLRKLQERLASGYEPNPQISEAQANVYGGDLSRQIMEERSAQEFDRNMSALQPTEGSRYADELWNNRGMAEQQVNAAQTPQYDDMRRRFGALLQMRGAPSNVTENPNSNLQDMDYRMRLFEQADPESGYAQVDRDGNPTTSSGGNVRTVTLPDGRTLAIRDDGAITSRRQPLYGEEARNARLEKKAKWDARRRDPELIERNMKMAQRRGWGTSVVRDALTRAGVETEGLSRSDGLAAVDAYRRSSAPLLDFLAKNKAGEKPNFGRPTGSAGQYSLGARAFAAQDNDRLASPQTPRDIAHADIIDRYWGLDTASNSRSFEAIVGAKTFQEDYATSSVEEQQDLAQAVMRHMRNQLLMSGNEFINSGEPDESGKIPPNSSLVKGLTKVDVDNPRDAKKWFDRYVAVVGRQQQEKGGDASGAARFLGKSGGGRTSGGGTVSPSGVSPYLPISPMN